MKTKCLYNIHENGLRFQFSIQKLLIDIHTNSIYLLLRNNLYIELVMANLLHLLCLLPFWGDKCTI